MHNAWITTAGEKMSKSLGNSLTIPAVLTKYRGAELRWYLVSHHYRSHVEFSFEALDEAATGFRRIETFLERAKSMTGVATEAGSHSLADLPEAFVAAMDDDLGTPGAVAVLFDEVKAGNKADDRVAVETSARAVLAMLDALGLHPADPAWVGAAHSETEALTDAVDALVRTLLEQRAAARAAKDFAAADAIRDTIKAAGVDVTDTPEGPRWSLA